MRDYNTLKERVPTANTNKKTELTQQNLRDFEERTNSIAGSSKRREKIIFSDKNKMVNATKGQKVEQDLNEQETPLEEEKVEDMEGEGEHDEENAENPNEADAEAEEIPPEDQVSLKSRSEVQSMSKASRKSYVESLRKELLKERQRREELEKQVMELAESRKSGM